MLAIRAMAKCMNDYKRSRGGGTRQRACTVLRFLRPEKGEPGENGVGYALVKFDGIDRVYLKAITNLELIHAPTHVRNGRAA